MLPINITRADLRTAWVAGFDDPGSEPAARQYRSAMMNNLAIPGALLGPAAAGCVALLGAASHEVLLVATLVGYAAAALYIALGTRRSAIKSAWTRQVDRTLHRGDYDVYTGPSVLTINETGIDQFRAGVSRIWIAWSEISGIEHDDEHVSARGGRAFAFSIPRRQLPEGMTTDDAAARIRAIHEASGAGELRRLRARLAGNDTPCPSCGYNLRGGADLHCPECGRRLRVEELGPAPTVS